MFKVRGLILSFICVLSLPGFVSGAKQQPSAGLSRQMKRLHEYERLQRVLEESNPKLCEQFVLLSEKVMARAKLAAQDKKAIQAFLKKVASDQNVNQRDKKSITQFLRPGLSTGAQVGIGVGSAAAVIAALAVLVARYGKLSMLPDDFSSRFRHEDGPARAGGLPVIPVSPLAVEEGSGGAGAALGNGAGRMSATGDRVSPVIGATPGAGIGAVVVGVHAGAADEDRLAGAGLGGDGPAGAGRGAGVDQAAVGVVGGARPGGSLLDIINDTPEQRLKRVAKACAFGDLQLALSQSAYKLKRSDFPTRLDGSCSAGGANPWDRALIAENRSSKINYDEIDFHPDWSLDSRSSPFVKTLQGRTLGYESLFGSYEEGMTKLRVEEIESTFLGARNSIIPVDEAFVNYLGGVVFPSKVLNIAKVVVRAHSFFLVMLDTHQAYVYAGILHDDKTASFAQIQPDEIFSSNNTVIFQVYFLNPERFERLNMSPARLAWMGAVIRSGIQRGREHITGQTS